ncbi:hypothetical protein OCU04_009823 [Sclerotinia nivalis]|uniref:Ubiquitin-like protease family profile domain-containing protein n=1 Tax=Sclerotinia nivalis TaxID=352851 RepID=A0A9X0DII4_9HELO|nr:hypothetical protein OCU04_009823 [Sclerotinia nivalis]
MEDPSYIVYKDFVRLSDYQYNPSTIAILKDFVYVVFYNEILSISVLQEIGDKIKEKPTNEDRIHLSMPKTYFMPELPEDWLRAASDTFENNFRYFQRYTSTSIKDSNSLKRLKPSSWLNDEVMEEYCKLITKACPNVYITSSFALESTNLQMKRFINKDNYTKLLNSIAIIPINEDNNHWTFACVWLETETLLLIEYYDSFSRSAPTWWSLPPALKRWIENTFPPTIEKKILQEISSQQSNGSDCGLFALMGLRMRAEGWPVFNQKRADEIMPQARHRVFAEIIAGHLNPTLEDMKNYNAIVSGEITFPDSPIMRSVSYSVETGHAGNEIINLLSPETESFKIDSENGVIEDVQSSTLDAMKTDVVRNTHHPMLDSMEMDGERDSMEDIHQPPIDSVEINGERDSTEDVFGFILKDIEGNDEGNRGNMLSPKPKMVAVESENHVIESHPSNVPNLVEAAGQGSPDLLKESQNHEQKLELELENEPSDTSLKSQNPEVASGRSFQTPTPTEDIKGKESATQGVISENIAQKHSSSFVPIRDVANLPSGSGPYQDDGQQSDVAPKKKRQKKEDSESLKQALLAADNFASQKALVDNLRAAIIAYRSRDQEQRDHDSLATLWSNIRPEEVTPQTIFQRYKRLNFARRWFEAKTRLPHHRREQVAGLKRILNLRGTFEEQEKEFKAAGIYARRCSFWVELIGQLPFLNDVCHEVAVCACGESTSELERFTDANRKKYFERILFRIQHEPNDIMEKIREAGPLYKALIEGRLPNYQLVLEDDGPLDGMTFAELVSLEPNSRYAVDVPV